MSVTTFACPKCAALLKTSDPATSGKKIKCPKCATIFPIPAPNAASAEAPVQARPEAASPPPKTRHEPMPESETPTEIQTPVSLAKPPAPAPEPAPTIAQVHPINQIILIDDDDTEVLSVHSVRDDPNEKDRRSDRPASRKSTERNPPKKKSKAPLVLGILGGGALVALALCCGGGYWAWHALTTKSWNEFMSSDGGFSASFPGKPKETTETGANGDTTHTFIVETNFGREAYAVIYLDTRGIADEGFLELLAGFEGTVKNKKPITLNGHSGFEFDIESSLGATPLLIRNRMFLVKQRVFQVMVTAVKDKVDSDDSRKFLDSFKLIGAYAAPANPIDGKKPPNENPVPPKSGFTSPDASLDALIKVMRDQDVEAYKAFVIKDDATRESDANKVDAQIKTGQAVNAEAAYKNIMQSELERTWREGHFKRYPVENRSPEKAFIVVLWEDMILGIHAKQYQFKRVDDDWYLVKQEEPDVKSLDPKYVWKKDTTPPKPSEAAKKIVAQLQEMKARATFEDGGWTIDVSSTEDVPAALTLAGGLAPIHEIWFGQNATDADFAAVAGWKDLHALTATFNKNITDAGVAKLDGLTKLNRLNLLYDQKVTAEGVAHLAGLTQLQFLDLSQVKLADKGAAHLAKLSDLKELHLAACQLTDDGLQPLAGLTHLVHLNLNENQITGPGLQHLAGLKELRELYCGENKLTDPGLEHLAGMPNLTRLGLSSNAITDDGLAHLAGLTNLRYLGLNRTKVNGSGFKHLAKWTQLQSLDLTTLPDLTGVGLENFANCKDLTNLNLSWTGVTDEGLAHIKQLNQLRSLDLPPYGMASRLPSEAFWHDPHPERFSDQGLKHIGEMKNLEWLWFAGAGVTDAGLAHLTGLKKLEHLGFGHLPNVKGPGLANLKELPLVTSLYLTETGVDDAGLKYVADLKQLQYLELSKKNTDAGLEHVKGLTQLKTLRLPEGISDAAVDSLKKSLAKTEIINPTFKDPNAAAKNTIEALNKLESYAYADQDGNWTVGFGPETDLAAAFPLADKLGRITNVALGANATDAHLARVAQWKDVAQLTLFGSHLTNDGLKALKDMKKLTALYLNEADKLTEDCLVHLDTLDGLTQFSIFEMKITDAGAKHVAGRTKLTSLVLMNCQLNDSAVGVLAPLTKLEELTLSRNEITGTGLSKLSGMKKLKHLTLSNNKITDESLKPIAGLTSLNTLALDANEIGDAGLAHLATLKELTFLSLANTKVKGPGFQHLAKLSKLTYLALYDMPDLTGVGLQHLAGCTDLVNLNLATTGITDEGLAQIKEIKHLTGLELPVYGQYEDGFWKDPHPERFSDAGLTHIAEMKELESLTFSGGGVTDAGMANLAGMTKLKYLGLGTLPNVKGPGLAHLKSLPELRDLNLNDTGVNDAGLKNIAEMKQITSIQLPKKATDAGLEHIKGLTQLTAIGVPKSVTDKGMEALKKALPKAEVYRQDE
jgi:Leucine-rich repeat (LRR) protein